jgi:GNAT superfamily N-acetyltransferase
MMQMVEPLDDASAAALGKAAFQGLVRFFLGVSQLRPDTWRVVSAGPLLVLHGHGPHGALTAALETEPGASGRDAQAVRTGIAEGSLIFVTALPEHESGVHDYLISQGFTRRVSPTMVAAATTLPLAEQLPSWLRVKTVGSDGMHALLSRIQVESLGEDFAPRAAMKRLFGLSPGGPVVHLLGLVGDQPVASATLMRFGEPASIWGVATVPEMRGRGIGRAMTLEACRLAHRLGHQTVSLYATPMGLPVYARLGFRECGCLSLYTISRT